MKYLSNVYQRVQEAKTKKALRVLYKQAKESKSRIMDSNATRSEKSEFSREFKRTVQYIKSREKQVK